MKTCLNAKVKLCYGVGDFGSNLQLQMVTLLFPFFLTDIFNIKPASAGLVLALSKIWDAVFDPLMGSIVDTTKTRWGKKRPYLLFGALPLAISFILLFWGPVLSADVRVAWALGTYILFCTAMSVVNVPYAALTVSLTHDYTDRTRLTTWRMTAALLGTLLAAGGARLLVDVFGGGAEGFRFTGILFSLIAATLILVTFFGVREIPDKINISKPKLFGNIQSVFYNKPFIMLSFATFLILSAVNILAGIVIYYFTYNLNEKGSETIGLAVLFVSAVLFLPLLYRISARFGKKEAYLFSMIAFILSLIGLFFFATSIIPTVLLFVIAGLGISGIFLMPWSMVADTTEYSEWKFGSRPEGALYGYFLFVVKAAAAAGGFVLMEFLGAGGYVANVAQTASSLFTIKLLLTLIPAIFILVGSLFLIRYPISKSMHDTMLADIETRIKKKNDL